MIKIINTIDWKSYWVGTAVSLFIVAIILGTIWYMFCWYMDGFKNG